MAQLPQKLSWEMAQNKWASQIDPILAIPMLRGIQLANIPIVSGVNVINHLLQRQQQGWMITDQTASASLFRSQPFNALTLTLTSDAPCTISLWVY